MKVLYCVADKGGCGWYRMQLPAKHLKEQGLCDTECIVSADLSNAKGVDICIIQRGFTQEALRNVKKLQRRGVFVVYELDDNLWLVPKENPNASFWTVERKSIAAEFVSACDGVITTNEAMADYLRRFNKNVSIMPNFVEKLSSKMSHKNKKLKIGWSGGDSHGIDFSEPIIQALLDIREMCNVELVFIGFVPDALAGHVRYSREVIPSDYLNKLQSIQFDIGIIPCADIEFNHYKSNIKFLEYSLLSIPTIASKMTPYMEVQNRGMLVDSTYKSWFIALWKLVQDATLREYLGNKAREFVEHNYIIENNVRSILQTYVNVRTYNKNKRRCKHELSC